MEIHRADKAYRSRALLLLGLTTLLCVVALLLLDGWLRRVNATLMASDPDTVRHWLRGLLAGLGLALAVPAALLGLGLPRWPSPHCCWHGPGGPGGGSPDRSDRGSGPCGQSRSMTPSSASAFCIISRAASLSFSWSSA